MRLKSSSEMHLKRVLTTISQVFFLFINGGVSSRYLSLPALYLSRTYWHRTSSDTLAVQTPQQLTIYSILTRSDHSFIISYF